MLTLTRTKTWAARFAMAAILVHMMSFVMSAHVNSDMYRLPLAPRAGKVAPNQNCVNNSNCASGVCHIGYDGTCDELNPDGSFAGCNGFVDSPYGYDNDFAYCEGFPLNHTCANQGECRNGFCNKKGICVKTTVGQACKDDLGCSNPQVCTNGTCVTPAPGSLYPQAPCKVGSSCKSGRCVTYLGNDSNNLGGKKSTSRPVCDYLDIGQKGCRTFSDCQTGQCQNGTCKQAVDGTRCDYNYECAQVCSLQGICYTPDKPLLPRQPCRKDSQCQSGTCVEQPGPADIHRPDENNPNKTVYAYFDLECGYSAFGVKCTTSDDCFEGNCVKGVCKGQALGTACSSDKVCKSLTCISGSCAIARAFVPCSRNSSCYSEVCSSAGSCPYYEPGCSTVHCQPVPLNGTCRRGADCEAGLWCTSGTCVYPSYHF